jgi:cyanosortase A-associated protein
MSWEKYRIRILAVIFSSALLITGRIILLPIIDKEKFTAFDFPQQIPLAQWKLNATNPLSKPIYEVEPLIALTNYQYLPKDIQKEQPLNIDMRYFVGSTSHTDVAGLVKGFYKTSSPPTQRYREAIGYYGIGIDQQQQTAYLSGCINPRGSSTFSMIQFTKNRYLHDVSPNRLLRTALGQDLLLDKRCLWAHLSIPLKNSSPETAYKVLENAWIDWYNWWQVNYPKP